MGKEDSLPRNYMKSNVNPSSDTPPIKTKKGRPPIAKQIKNSTDLKEFFENNVGEGQTALALGLSVHTVSNYFKKWKHELLVRNDRNVIERQEIARERALEAIDKVIIDVLLHKGKIRTLTEKFDGKIEAREKAGEESGYPVNFFLENKRMELNQLFVELQVWKAKVEMAPTATQIMEEHIKEMLEKNNALRSSLEQ